MNPNASHNNPTLLTPTSASAPAPRPQLFPHQCLLGSIEKVEQFAYPSEKQQQLRISIKGRQKLRLRGSKLLTEGRSKGVMLGVQDSTYGNQLQYSNLTKGADMGEGARGWAGQGRGEGSRGLGLGVGGEQGQNCQRGLAWVGLEGHGGDKKDQKDRRQKCGSEQNYLGEKILNVVGEEQKRGGNFSIFDFSQDSDDQGNSQDECRNQDSKSDSDRQTEINFQAEVKKQIDRQKSIKNFFMDSPKLQNNSNITFQSEMQKFMNTEQQIIMLKSEIACLKTQNQKIKCYYEEKIKQMNKRNNFQLNTVKSLQQKQQEHNRQIKALRQDHERDILKIVAEKDKEIKELSDKSRKQIVTIKTQFQNLMKRNEANLKKQISKLSKQASKKQIYEGLMQKIASELKQQQNKSQQLKRVMCSGSKIIKPAPESPPTKPPKLPDPHQQPKAKPKLPVEPLHEKQLKTLAMKIQNLQSELKLLHHLNQTLTCKQQYYKQQLESSIRESNTYINQIVRHTDTIGELQIRYEREIMELKDKIEEERESGRQRARVAEWRAVEREGHFGEILRECCRVVVGAQAEKTELRQKLEQMEEEKRVREIEMDGLKRQVREMRKQIQGYYHVVQEHSRVSQAVQAYFEQKNSKNCSQTSTKQVHLSYLIQDLINQNQVLAQKLQILSKDNNILKKSLIAPAPQLPSQQKHCQLTDLCTSSTETPTPINQQYEKMIQFLKNCINDYKTVTLQLKHKVQTQQYTISTYNQVLYFFQLDPADPQCHNQLLNIVQALMGKLDKTVTSARELQKQVEKLTDENHGLKQRRNKLVREINRFNALTERACFENQELRTGLQAMYVKVDHLGQVNKHLSEIIEANTRQIMKRDMKMLETKLQEANVEEIGTQSNFYKKQSQTTLGLSTSFQAQPSFSLLLLSSPTKSPQKLPQPA